MSEKIFDAVLMSKVIDALKSVYDPEMPVNVYDLGLIYDIALYEDNKITITMTLTNPNCPVADSLPNSVKKAVSSIMDAKEVTIKLTFDPPWNPDKISDEARLNMGLF